MIRTTSHSLQFATDFKKNKLDDLFSEYQIVVNKFINLFWNEKKLVSKPNKDQWRQVESWMCGKAMKCAYRQAIQMIKSTKDKQNKLVWKQYKSVFKRAKDRNKDWDIIKLKWSEWSKDKKFRDKTKIPEFNGNSIELNSDLITVYTETKVKSFDLIVRLGSIFGNRYSLVLPTKKHKQFNKHISNGFNVNSSGRLRRSQNGQYFVDLFLEKETPQVKESGELLGIDVGIKKLMSLSNGEFIGKEIERLIQKVKSKKQNSLNQKKAIKEVKDYIGKCVNELELDNLSTIVIEDIKQSKMMKRGKSSKSHRKTLSKWYHNLFVGRLSGRCEENRVFLTSINPAYTSQKCSHCGEIHSESRNCEIYLCKSCGMQMDADHNASINIKNCFLNKESTVPNDIKSCISLHNFV